jgi:hypothetical protein
LAGFRKLFGGDGHVHLPLPKDPIQPHEIFEMLTKSENEFIQASAKEPFRIIQANVALDRIEHIFVTLHSQLAESDDELPT